MWANLLWNLRESYMFAPAGGTCWVTPLSS